MNRNPPLPQLPTEPLHAAARRQGRTLHAAIVAAGWRPQHRAMREAIGWIAADRFACALGLHPSEVWGEDWWGIEEAYQAWLADTDEGWAELFRAERQRANQLERQRMDLDEDVPERVRLAS